MKHMVRRGWDYTPAQPIVGIDKTVHEVGAPAPLRFMVEMWEKDDGITVFPGAGIDCKVLPPSVGGHAGPQSRKMSATSRAGRDMTVGDLCRRLAPVSRQRETIQWAHDRADRVGGHMRVECGGVDLGMAKQDLDQTNVGFLLQQVRGEAVPQRVRRHPLLDLGDLGGGVNGAVELARR